MSDIPQDQIDETISRDKRFAILALAIAVESDLRDNETIKALMNAVRADADQAMEDLANTSPANTEAIALLLVTVRTLVYIRRTLNIIIRRGQAAEQQIRADDQQERQE